MTVTGTPTKLRSGEWGCRGQAGHLNKGKVVTVTVTTRSGKTWTKDYKVLWCDNGGQFLAAPVKERTSGYRRTSGYSWNGVHQPNGGGGTYHDRVHEEAVDMGRACPVCRSHN